MSELMNIEGRRDFRWKLLLTVSSLALAAAAGPQSAFASDDATHPSVWIELGGQLERIDSPQDPHAPHFTLLSPTPAPYSPISPAEAQKPSIYSYGAEGKITLTPGDTGWRFSAAVRYGRSNNNKHVHQQTTVQSQYADPKYPANPSAPPFITKSSERFADFRVKNSESHAVVDFQAGHDVGLGLFGRGSSSIASFGIRLADFASKSHAKMIARPDAKFHEVPVYGKYVHAPYHTDYVSVSDNERSFRGVGPSVSWDGFVPVFGNPDGEITFDWGVNAALLFGRQKAKGTHETTARYYNEKYYQTVPPYGAIPVYRHPLLAHDRSRSIIVPNIGGLAGISFRYSAAKVSFGYRADFFLGAIDTGIDARHTVDRNFYGPFATISMGL